jgi:heptosyltransferase-2
MNGPVWQGLASLKRTLKQQALHGLIQTWARLQTKPPTQAAAPHRDKEPGRILVLRNNDLGDVLTTTPLLKALRQLYPKAHIAAAVGPWAAPLLQHNPHVDAVLPVGAPWHNHHTGAKYPASSLLGFISALSYLVRSPEMIPVRQAAWDVGIDVLGSPQGTLLLLAARAQHRVGMAGYASDGTGLHAWAAFDPEQHVSANQLALAQALAQSLQHKKTALGLLPNTANIANTANTPCSPTPEVYLTAAERSWAQQRWQDLARGHSLGSGGPRFRLLLAPGGGYPQKCWPLGYFAELARCLGHTGRYQLVALGGGQDTRLIEHLAAYAPGAIVAAGPTSLREALALTASAQGVISNSSFVMHAAAAFEKPNLVLLGPDFNDAASHARLWGYATTRVLGKKSPQDHVPTPRAALKALCDLLGHPHPEGL